MGRELLEEIAREHDQSHGFTPRLIECRASVLREFLPRGRLLDVGCADGLLTRLFAAGQVQVVGIDGSALRIARARDNCKGLPVELVETMFEDYQPEAPFDSIVVSRMIELLDDPVAFLARCRTMLRPGGTIACIVRHGNSLHRRVGVHMGLLPDIQAPGPADGALEHKRVYTIPALRDELIEAEFEIVESGGILLKPLPNAAMQGLAPGVVDAFEALGRELPELAAEIFTIALRRV